MELAVCGTRAPLHPVDPSYCRAVESKLMPWQGDDEVLIDRFDGRNELLEVDRGSGRAEDERAPSDESDEVRSRFEAYRDLLLLETSGMDDATCLAQIALRDGAKPPAAEKSPTDKSRRRVDPFEDICQQFDAMAQSQRSMLGKVAELFGIINLGKQVRLDQQDRGRRPLDPSLIVQSRPAQPAPAQDLGRRASEGRPTPRAADPAALTPMERLRLKAQELIGKQMEKDHAKQQQREREKEAERQVGCTLVCIVLLYAGRSARQSWPPCGRRRDRAGGRQTRRGEAAAERRGEAGRAAAVDLPGGIATGAGADLPSGAAAGAVNGRRGEVAAAHHRGELARGPRGAVVVAVVVPAPTTSCRSGTGGACETSSGRLWPNPPVFANFHRHRTKIKILLKNPTRTQNVSFYD